MKTTTFAIGLLVAALALATAPARATTNDLTSAIQRGLFEEEANQNLGAAIQAYQTVANQFDRDRKLAATAIFRLGECYRKQGNTNEAAVQYERVLREFSDQPTLVSLSRQNLSSLGGAPTASGMPEAARQQQQRLLEEEIKLVQKQLEAQQKQVQVGALPPYGLIPTQRDLSQLRGQLAALEAGLPASMPSSDAAANAAAQAEEDVLTLDAQLAAFKGLPKDKLRIAVEQSYPNPVLNTLMSTLASEEQKLAALERSYGPEHTEVVAKVAQIEAINKQIDAQVEAAIKALEIKRDIATAIAKRFQAQTAAAAAPPKESAAGATSAPTTASEAEEVKRIQAMIKDSPDLINAKSTASGVFGKTPLHMAADRGQLIVAQFLLANGADVEAKDNGGGTPLHDATRGGHKSMVELLLDHHANVQATDNDGDTPLHLAAEHGYLSVAETLLAHGAQVNAKDQGGATPLISAVASGSRPIAELLLARGADVNVSASSVRVESGQRPYNGTALDIAVRRGDQPMVELLLSKKADIAAADDSGDSPLAIAAAQGDLAIAEALLAKGADVNARNTGASYSQNQLQLAKGANGFARNTGNEHRGWTPLHWAVEHNHKNMVALLLKHKADPNARMESRYGEGGPSYTPLLMATARVFPDIVEVLLDSGADPNLGTETRSPIMNAMNNEDPSARLEMLKSLLQHGANIETTDPRGDTPLWMAAVRGDKDAMALLLAHKANPNAQNKSAVSGILDSLVQSDRSRDVKPLMQMLLTAGADVNAREENGNTPLHAAVYYDLRDRAQLLLANKADPNAKNMSGETPLHLAVLKGEKEMAELLLANKADPNERDNRGRTPLDMAKGMAQQAHLVLSGSGQLYLGGPSGASGVAAQAEPKPETMADLLRRQGALDDLPHMDQIGVRRTTSGFSNALFTKGAQDWNHFTLLELLAVQYGFLASGQETTASKVVGARTFYRDEGLPFPDLAHLHISRPARDLKSWHDEVVDLTPVLESGDCTKDVPLQWGDVVEIPEADHPLNETWGGFSREEMGNFRKCLARKVEIVVKGQVTPVTLAPQMSYLEDKAYEVQITPALPFWLRPVLLQSKLVLISSDLSHVKVTRRDAATGQKREWVVDCSKGGESAPDLWLEDGDRIEVPEKSYASAAAPAEAEAQAAVPRMVPLPAPVQRLPRAIPPALPMRTLPPPAAMPQAAMPLPSQGRPDRLRQAPAVPLPGGPTLTYQWNATLPQAAPAAEAPPAANTPQPEFGGVRYSPKAMDSELLNAGYQKDRTAKPRQAESWEQRATPGLPGRGGNTAVWTGYELIVFGGEGMGTSFADGARYSLAENTWALLPDKGEPSSRTGHAAVWTGKEMIIWGGFGGIWGNDTNHNDGARYNPSTDTWKPMSTRNAPTARFDVPAVWTGRQMLVWGGYTDSHSRYQGCHADAHLNTGGRYDPASDSWKAITTRGAPSKRNAHAAVWTGKEMIVWGGDDATKVLGDGARYNPARDSWKPMSADGAPSPRGNPVAVWTGKEMIVWGGGTREMDAQGVCFENGARYNPQTDTWKPISTVGGPKGRVQATAVWTGTEMAVWGGVNDVQAGQGGNNSRFVGTGGRYNPATDTWREITLTGAPSPRLTSGVWTGEGLLIFGGYNGAHLKDTWFYWPLATLYPYVKR